MTDDFAHRLPLDQIRDGERIDLIADEDERQPHRRPARPARARSARRACDAGARGRDRPRPRAAEAALGQSCVVTGEPVAAHVDEPFEIDFLPEPKSGEPDEEVELGAADCDVVFHDGAAIDLGSASPIRWR